MRVLRSIVLIVASFSTALACPASDEGRSRGTAADTVPSPAAVSPAPEPLVAAADQSRILGDTAAPVWVVIVSDFQCPYCKVWHDETFPALKREFVDKGQVRLAYLNLPLPQHQHARTTAELALCAGAQGRFWEYHDALFDTQAEWSRMPSGTTYFDTLSSRAGVDRSQLRSCMERGTMRALVEADFQRGMEAKVGSTPSFFIGNDTRLQGVQPIAAFRQAILNARSRAVPSGSR
jgi:protein-disulfide isomerase